MTDLEKKDEASENTVYNKTTNYLTYYTDSAHVDSSIIKKRAANYSEIANYFYDLVTDFYEYGWGASFHFAYPYKGESYDAANRRLEHYLAHRLNIQKGQKVLDVGCGIGGPMREFVTFSGANVIGLNNNLYQIQKAEQYNKKFPLSTLCSFVKADYMEPLPFEDETFDGIFTLEALCYAPDPVKVYTELFRVLKKGQYFAGTDWALTPRYDAKNQQHVRIKEGIAKGNGLFDLRPTDTIITSLEKAGFEIIEHKDLADDAGPSSTWYQPLESKMSLKGFRRTSIGRFFTNRMVSALEFLRIAPKGTTAITQFLNVAADSLVESGQLKIFTPGLFFLAKKPID